MSLTEQLTALRERNCANLSQEINAIMAEATKRLSESELVDQAPKAGEKLLNFSLFNHLGEKRDLTSLREKGPVVVTFYRGGWCPYCSLQLHAYQEALQDIQAAGATLVAITPEFPDESLSTREKNELEFEVLSDVNADYARELGLVYTLPKKLRPLYESFGIDLEKHNGIGQFDLPLAATFIVDIDGTITSAFVTADYTVRQEPGAIVAELKALVKSKVRC
jgi:peroxiredoxin